MMKPLKLLTLAVHLLPTLSPPFTGLATIDRNEDGAPSPKGRMEPEKSQKQRGCTVAVEEGENLTGEKPALASTGQQKFLCSALLRQAFAG